MLTSLTTLSLWVSKRITTACRSVPSTGSVRAAKAFLRPETEIWIDGGVNESNLQEIVTAGVDGLVIGSRFSRHRAQ